jgi:hypothetical protein
MLSLILGGLKTEASVGTMVEILISFWYFDPQETPEGKISQVS